MRPWRKKFLERFEHAPERVKREIVRRPEKTEKEWNEIYEKLIGDAFEWVPPMRNSCDILAEYIDGQSSSTRLYRSGYGD